MRNKKMNNVRVDVDVKGESPTIAKWALVSNQHDFLSIFGIR